MRKLLITLDDDISKELSKYPNQSETLREAFRIYNEHISTDTLAGMRMAFQTIDNNVKEMEERFMEQYELVEKTYNLLSELAGK